MMMSRMNQQSQQSIKSWAQTILIILAVVGALLANERRTTMVEQGYQTLVRITADQDKRIKALEDLVGIVTRTQARVVAIQEQILKRHEMEDARRLREK